MKLVHYMMYRDNLIRLALDMPNNEVEITCPETNDNTTIKVSLSDLSDTVSEFVAAATTCGESLL